MNELDFPGNPLEGDSYISPLTDKWLKLPKSWRETSDLSANPTSFVTEWNIENDNDSITLPLVSGLVYGFTVDWGDDTESKINAFDQAEATHQYATAGTYQVSIAGVFQGLDFTGSSSASNITHVLRLGNVKWTTFQNAFRDCINLTSFVAGETDTSLITSTQNMFKNAVNLDTVSFGTMDTSLVTTMLGMFMGCAKLLSLNVSTLITDEVITMAFMFEGTGITSLDISMWNTAKVLDMSYMFQNSDIAEIITLGIQTSLVTTMVGMFMNASSITSLPFAGLNLLSITDLTDFGNGTSALNTATFPDLPAATTLTRAFKSSGITSFNMDFAMPLVTNVSEMFSQGTRITIVNFNNDMSGVLNMSYMLWECPKLVEINLSNKDLSSVTDISFFATSALLLKTIDMTNLNLSSAITMSNFAQGCSRLNSFITSGINTSALQNMSYLLSGCSTITTVDFGEFDTANLTDISYAMDSCVKLIPSNLDTINVTSLLNGTNMMRNCNVYQITQYDDLLEAWSLQTVLADVVIHFGDVQYNAKFEKSVLTETPNDWIITDGGPVPDHDFVTTWVTTTTDQEIAFPLQLNNGSGHDYVYDFTVDWGDGSAIETITAYQARVTHTYSGTGTYSVRMSGICERLYFWNDAGKAALRSVDNFGTMQWYNPNGMFATCYNLESFTVGTSDMSNITDLSSWLTSLNVLASIDINGLTTGTLTSIYSMFRDNSLLTSISGLDVLDTSSVTNAAGVFRGCAKLTSLNLASFDFSSVEDMSLMFENMYDLITIILPDMSNSSGLTTVYNLFNACVDLTGVDFGNADFSALTNLSGVFNSCSVITSIDFSGITGGSPTTWLRSFEACYDLPSIDLSKFNFGDVTDCAYTFKNCYDLANVTLHSTNSPDMSSLTSAVEMFRATYIPSTSMFNNVTFGSATVGPSFHSMFYSCQQLTTPDFFTANNLQYVISIAAIFRYARFNSISLLNADLNDCITISNALQGNGLVTSIDCTGLKIPNCISAAFFADACGALLTIDLTGIVDGSLTSLAGFSSACNSLTSANLDQFNITKMLHMNNIMFSSNSWPTSQYDDTLVAWAAQGGIPLINNPNFGDVKYTEVAARNSLIADGWVIVDGGPA